jgi:sugar-specific transcriptional regulator TrmB
VGINPVKREDLSASIKGRTTISNHLKEIIDSANKEVIICMSAEEMKSKEKLFLDTFSKLKKKEIEVKIALSGDEEVVKSLSNFLKIKIKKVDIEGKFFIVDRSEVLFYISKESSKEDQAIWLNSEFFSTAFAGLFDVAVGLK